MSPSLDDQLALAASVLHGSRHAVAFTGAGISTPSGIPDFRSARTGLWARYNPMEVASLETFQKRPERFYEWLRPLLRNSWDAQPNPAHIALANLETAGVIKAVITQNIDNLHQRAGSKTVYEVHGSTRTVSCASCRANYPAEQFEEQLRVEDTMPRCPQCDRILKPDITLFGEMLPEKTWLEAEQHCLRADVILVAGSSLEVWPAASLPALAVENGASLILNNLTPTPLDARAQVLLQANVVEVLPELARLVL